MITRFIGALLCASFVHAQANLAPQELLKEAVTLQEAGKLDEAVHDYSLFLAIYPNATQVRSNLGAALVGEGKYKQAIEQYKLALAAKPDDGAVRFNLSLAYYKAGQYHEAGRELRSLREVDPQNTNALLLLADCELRQGNNKEVIELLTPLRRAEPDNLGLAYLLGTALVRDGRVSEGQVVIDQIMSRGDSAEVRLLMGTTKFAAHEFAPAVVDLAKAVEMNPQLPSAWSYYGLALFATGDMTGSRTAFNKALEQDANDFDANLHIGTMLRLDGELEHAQQRLEKAASVRPGDPATEYQIALVKLAQGKTIQAQDDLEALVKAAPSFTEAHVSLATVYYREKRKEDGDRERAIVQKLNAEHQATQPGAKLSAAEQAK